LRGRLASFCLVGTIVIVFLITGTEASAQNIEHFGFDSHPYFINHNGTIVYYNSYFEDNGISEDSIITNMYAPCYTGPIKLKLTELRDTGKLFSSHIIFTDGSCSSIAPPSSILDSTGQFELITSVGQIITADMYPFQITPLSSCSCDGHTDDSVGTNGGVVMGVEKYVNGMINQAFDFDGSTTIQIDSGLVTTNDEYSITAWVKKASGSLGSVAAVYSEENSSSVTQTKLMYWGENFGNGNVKLRIFQRDSSGVANNVSFDSGIPITDTDWHHIAWVQTSATSYDVYVDGAKIGTKNWIISWWNLYS